MSFLPKIISAQVEAICLAREERGVPPYEFYGGKEHMFKIPVGSLCFIPDFKMNKGDALPSYKRIKGEPLFLATDDTDQFVIFDKHGDFRMVNIVEELDLNYEIKNGGEDGEFYMLVVHNLNFLFTDVGVPPSLAVQQQSIADHLKSAANYSQMLADRMAPPKKELPFI